MSVRVLCVFGTRPEAIKMAPVVRELKARPGDFECLVCMTAQHREMADQIMQGFGLSADFDLDLMRQSQTPAEVASRILHELPPILTATRPDMLLVQGDTTTTMAASLAAFMERTAVGHVEAGLRTHNLMQPFPEEMNRRVTSIVTALHFPPTEGARQALLAEGVPDARIVVTGNTVIDALLASVRGNYAFEEPGLRDLPDRPLLLVTVHRRENFGAPLEQICAAITRIASEFPELQIVLPVHRNPNVRGVVEPRLGAVRNIRLVQPLGYFDFVHLMARSRIVLTDSGGVQEEAPSLGKPVLVLREVTERPEGVTAGTARLVGTAEDRICDNVRTLLTEPAEYDRMARAVNPYGDGKAAARIADAISDWSRRRTDQE